MTTTALPTSTRVAPRALDDLRGRVAGVVHTPGERTWDAARTPWALAVEQHPLAVAEVRDAADVQAAIRWAAEHDLQVTAQPSGHGASGDLSEVLLLRTRGLDGITVDVNRRTARVGAGVKAAELLAALDGTGLTFLSGSNPDPSVVGLTIGGGMSWFGRAYGIGANAVVAVDLVDGLGRIRHVTRDTDPDLFWAVRGGGGDFGIVTAIELSLFPAPAIYGGRLMWPVSRMREVLSTFRAIAESAPDELTMWYHTYRFPPLPMIPEPLRGKAFASVAVAFLGEPEDAERRLAPFRAVPDLAIDQLRVVALRDLGTIGDEPTAPSRGLETSALLHGLDDALIDRLVDEVGEDSGSPLAVFQIRHLGARFAQRDPDQGAAGYLDEPYSMFALGITPVPALDGPVGAALGRLRQAIATWSSDRTVFNFLGPNGDVARCWTTDVRERLIAIKADVDPFSTIRSNHPVAGPAR